MFVGRNGLVQRQVMLRKSMEESSAQGVCVVCVFVCVCVCVLCVCACVCVLYVMLYPVCCNSSQKTTTRVEEAAPKAVV